MELPRRAVTKDGESFIIRVAVPDDAEQILAGVRAQLAERLEGLVTQLEEFTATVEQEKSWIQGLIGAENSILLVAEHAGQLVGWVDLRGGKRLRERHTAMLGIAISRPWRGLGVGGALMQAVLDWAADNPVLDKIKLQVTANNAPALALYRRLGFEQEGYQRRELKRADGTYLDTIMMCRFVK